MAQTLIRRAFNLWRENFSARLDENGPQPKTWREILNDLPELQAAPKPNQNLVRKSAPARPKSIAAEFATSPALQAEFGTRGCYAAWLKHQHSVRIVGNVVIR